MYDCDRDEHRDMEFEMYEMEQEHEENIAKTKRESLDTKFFAGARVNTITTDWINDEFSDSFKWLYPKNQGNVLMHAGAEWNIAGFVLRNNKPMVFLKLAEYCSSHQGTSYLHPKTIALMTPQRCKNMFGIKGIAPNPIDDTRIDTNKTYKTPINFYIKNHTLQIDKVKGATLISEQSMVKPVGIIKENNVDFVMLELVAPFYNEYNNVADVGEWFSIPLNDMHALPFNSWETLDKDTKDSILAGVKERLDKKDEERKLKIQEEANDATRALAHSNNNMASSSSSSSPNYASIARSGGRHGGSTFDNGGGMGSALIAGGIGGMVGLALGGGGGCD